MRGGWYCCCEGCPANCRLTPACPIANWARSPHDRARQRLQQALPADRQAPEAAVEHPRAVRLAHCPDRRSSSGGPDGERRVPPPPPRYSRRPLRSLDGAGQHPGKPMARKRGPRSAQRYRGGSGGIRAATGLPATTSASAHEANHSTAGVGAHSALRASTLSLLGEQRQKLFEVGVAVVVEITVAVLGIAGVQAVLRLPEIGLPVMVGIRIRREACRQAGPSANLAR